MTSGSLKKHAAAFILAGLVFLQAVTGQAAADGRVEDWRLDPGASIRFLGAGFHYYDEPRLFGEGNEIDGLAQSIIRLTMDGQSDDILSFEAHLVADLTWTTAPGGFVAMGSIGGRAAKRYRSVEVSWDWLDESRWEGRIFLDRFNLKYAFPSMDVTIGRQAINFSQAYFWNPLDIFLPFDPEAFDRDYKPGVDALRVDYTLGPYSSLTLVAAAGREIVVDAGEEGPELSMKNFSDEPWYGSALLARARTNWREWDLTLQGGKVYGGWQAGVGFSGDAMELGIRGEATWFSAAGGRELSYGDDKKVELAGDHAAAVIGVDHRFENGLHVNVEYLYNGAGGDDLFTGMIRTATGGTISLGRHLLGADMSYEFHPLVNGHLSWIRSFSDSSSLVSPTVAISMSDESDLILGATIGIGDRPESAGGDGGTFESLEFRSEFGTYPNIFFMEFKYYL